MTRNPTVCALFCILGLSLSMVSRADEPKPPTNDPRAVVEGLYRAFDRGDLAAVRAMIADDCVWTYYAPEHALPFAGEFRGPDGVFEFFRMVDEFLVDARAGQRDLIVSGDQVAVPGWEESTVRATGGRYRVSNMHLFKVHDNKIVKFEEFIDSSEVVDAFADADAARGRALFTGCAGCHGSQAEGNPGVGAPGLVGLGTDYLTRQLRAFRAGVRGNSFDDSHGYMMVGPARSLPGDRGVRDVVAFIEQQPVASASASVRGDVERGKRLYVSCAACHGASAQGVEALRAPRLNHLDGQYLLRQLQHFADGVRGAAPEDVEGQQMRQAVSQLSDARAMRDVVAYIVSR